MNFNILNIGEHVVSDESITDKEFHTHAPYANTTLNNSDEIRIPVQTQDTYTLPSESYLYIKGKLLDSEKKRRATLTLVSNAIAHLFDEIRYELGGSVIDRVRNSDITTTLKAFASFSPTDCVRYKGAGWRADDTCDIMNSDGLFNACVPLKMFLGFCEDFKKIVVNMRQELVLIRSTSDLNAMYSGAQEKSPKIVLNKILWKIPHVRVSDAKKLQIWNFLESGRDLELAYRSWELMDYPVLQQTTKHTWNVKATNQLEKPRFIIFAFQADKKNKLDKNSSTFDHCSLTNIKLYLNSEVYPYDNLNMDFEKWQFMILYEMFAKFQESYYYKKVGEPCLTPTAFRSTAPLAIIDCSRQNENLKSGSVDIRLEFETGKNLPFEHHSLLFNITRPLC